MLKQQLLSRSEALFMRYGIRSVSMDDISRELGISKKTLYQQVENKSDLIRQIFVNRLAIERAEIHEMRLRSEDAVDELVLVGRYMIGQLRQLSPSSRYDLEKYYQDIHEELDQLHMSFFIRFIQENLERGIADGIYRKNIEVKVVAKLFVGMATRLGHNEYFAVSDYDLAGLVKQLFYYHIHGVASEQGMALVRTYLGAENEESL